MQPDDLPKTKTAVLGFLREGPAAVDDIATELGLTRNAVRFHLDSLERAGLVAPDGIRRLPRAGKPAILYSITPVAELQFSRAYAPVLVACLKELRETLPRASVLAFLRRVGTRLAPATLRSQPLSSRVKSAAMLLNDLGGSASIKRTKEGYAIEGRGCPLSAAVSEEPCICEAVRTMIFRIVDAEVTEKCDRSGRPNCRFEISAA